MRGAIGLTIKDVREVVGGGTLIFFQILYYVTLISYLLGSKFVKALFKLLSMIIGLQLSIIKVIVGS